MTGPDALFTLIVVLGFLASAFDHWLFGKGKLNPYVRLLYLACVIVVDGWLAVTVNPALGLWVLLYLFGAWNAVKAQRAAETRRLHIERASKKQC